MASLARLTSLSTQTLSLLLERQRLQTLSNPNASSLHVPQIARNMQQLHVGVLQLEQNDGRSEAVNLLRSQYERMRDMLGSDADVANVPKFVARESPQTSAEASVSSSSLPSPPVSAAPLPVPIKDDEPAYVPYTDDPEAAYPSHEEMLQAQRQMMDEQDVHLDRLSQSVNRQRDISLHINDELEVHTGLLEDLDIEMDRTGGRLSGARRRLDRVARGAKENGSTVMIALLILVLLILIIIFKT
ncbi:uncharacterized protein LAESUDRAFT_659143 [Laetiporus sulphureus 93-53]|uniref:t-SNARE coiled-coil homology domain-containing protein n=1 Tax=Laetiporus sulphureus 93-53 TaxID=1314785 RepID=A0A165CWT1_9APHY|nr:uncharacterized protein LAESUDRAFT_659143 [Laetiporus sulphureus 93-53]KZT03611.1 hypothetical protein LAESUDRAFT_659143 [Laetiporus sulphureus 93-53]